MLDFFVNDCPFVLLFFLIIKNNNDELKEWKFNQTKILTGEVFLNPSNVLNISEYFFYLKNLSIQGFYWNENKSQRRASK
jgi:hypothetical protein